MARSVQDYFSDVVDPLMRPLMQALERDRPSKEILGDFIIDFVKARERTSLESSINTNVGANDTQTEVIGREQAIEMDSELAEDVDISSLLLPVGFEPLASLDHVRDKFCLSYSKNAMTGWVKQPSPCCAAASAAGALNICFGLNRSDSQAHSHSTLVPIFADILREQVKTMQARLERLIGAPLDDLLQQLNRRLEAQGMSLGGKNQPLSSTKKQNQALLRSTVFEGRQAVLLARQGDDPTVSDTVSLPSRPGEIFLRLGELYDEAKEGEGESDESSSESDEGADGDEEALVECVQMGRTSKKKKNAKKTWRWKHELGEWLHKLGGCEKIEFAKPSTAPFGNNGVMSALRRLGENQIKCRLLMGKKLKSAGEGYFGLSRADDSTTIAAQWAGLRSAFLLHNAAIIFHLKNHYALVFAMREWEDPNTRSVVRQVLTSRRGQRPSAWVDFDEARNTMLAWEGYKMILVERKDPSAAADSL